MKPNQELVPMSAQERKEDIDMLMDSEMMDSTVGGSCTSCTLLCITCIFGKSKKKDETSKPEEGEGGELT